MVCRHVVCLGGDGGVDSGSRSRRLWLSFCLYVPLQAYAESRIYVSVESSFAILAEPNRRAILSVLATSERSVGDIQRQLKMPQPSLSKHLRVLREAGFVEARVDAQRRLYRIRPEPLMQVDAWLSPFRRLWSSHLDALEQHLDRIHPIPKKGRRR